MPDAVENQVKEMIVERCFLGIAPEDISDGADLMDEVGLDSIQILEVVVGLEETFGVSFEDADFDIENFRNVRAIGAFVRERTGS
jgi:acyl carrier protein